MRSDTFLSSLYLSDLLKWIKVDKKFVHGTQYEKEGLDKLKTAFVENFSILFGMARRLQKRFGLLFLFSFLLKIVVKNYSW